MPVDDLACFLRSRRAAVDPAAIGLACDRRRVPGLRREEVAHLAGVSVAYYTRLEQGQSQNASAEVLDALSRALQLDGDARAHLHNLARPPKPEADEEGAITSTLERLLLGLDALPACVLGPRMEVLAWNSLGHALLAGHLDLDSPASEETRPNMARLVFLDPHTRELFADWHEKAREAVAYLRISAGRRPADARLASLIGELSIRSEAFASLWAAAPVEDKTCGTRRFAHPLVGAMELDFQALAVPGRNGQLLVTFSPAPGSTSDATLRLLAGSLASGPPRWMATGQPAAD